jgi:plastocyanin
MQRLPGLRSALCLLMIAGYSALGHGASLRVRVENIQGVPLADSVVYLTPAVAVARSALTPVKIDQVHKAFVPRISVVQVGTAISFPNSDNIRHSIYSFSAPRIFTLKLYSGTPSSPVVFDKPGVVVLGCNIHDQMVAWVLVIDTPYIIHSDADGYATLSNLPAGDYVLRAWHEPLAEEAAGEPLHLDASATATHTIKLDVDAQAAKMAGMEP